jgi:26S proteasome regulatory subunit N7
MADDSTPLPYPNLKVPQWHYQIQNVPRLKEQASSSFWKAVEEDGESDHPLLGRSQDADT